MQKKQKKFKLTHIFANKFASIHKYPVKNINATEVCILFTPPDCSFSICKDTSFNYTLNSVDNGVESI